MLLQWRTLKPKLLTYYTEKLKLAFLWYSSWATSCDFVSSPTFTFTSAQPTSDRLLFCRAFRGADGAKPESLPINLSCRARKAKFRGVLVTSDCEKFFHVKSSFITSVTTIPRRFYPLQSNQSFILSQLYTQRQKMKRKFVAVGLFCGWGNYYVIYLTSVS